MSDKTKKGLLIGGLTAVAAGTVCVCIAVGVNAGVDQATKVATLAGAAVTAIGALVLAILGKK